MAATRDQRRRFLSTVGFTVLLVVVLLFAYFTVPLGQNENESIVLRVFVALLIFGAFVAFEIWRIVRAASPQLRAVTALVRIVPVFVILFAWMYFAISVSEPQTFGHTLTRTAALYFTVTVLSTVGFGDIAPVSEAGQLVVTVQMVCDLLLVGALFKLVMGTATIVKARRANVGGPGAGGPAVPAAGADEAGADESVPGADGAGVGGQGAASPPSPAS